MATGHDHFEELAVGHVLGGLEHAAAARFRSHLTGCRDCRARVAELRGIASDLQAAERDELARTRAAGTDASDVAGVKTEVARRDDGDDPLHTAWLIPRRALAGVLAVSLVLALGLAFWNFHLRDQNARLVEVTRAREAILDGLATGRSVPAELSAGVTGQIVTDTTDVTVDLAGFPSLGSDEQLVVWLLGDDATEHYWRGYRTDDLPEGRLAFRDPHRGAERLVVTVEQGQRGDEPAGRELVTAELRHARP